MLLIYTHRLTSRNKYTFKLIFENILGIEIKITTNKDEFIAWDKHKLTYCKQAIGDEAFFISTELLFQTGIVVQEPTTTRWNGSKVFFPVAKTSAMPFDPFAAAFLLVSRYEEYLPHLKDRHGRFIPAQSMAFQNGFLQQPVVNQWAWEIKKILEKKFGVLASNERKYKFIPTIDIDNAWAFRHKGFIRIGGGLFSDLFKLDFKSFKSRFKSVFHFQKDPYDTYDIQYKLFEYYKLKPIFFILLADYATFDKSVPHQNKHMQSLIKYMGDIGDVGIHPSYASAENPAKIRNEIARLGHILHQEIHLSRQHFLRLSIPETYQRLLEYDITDDYTMGYPDLPGFRASICTPFFFYDLDLEIETSLRIHPFAIMDGTLKDYMNIDPGKAMDIINPLINSVKSVHGDFISIWHNESFAENERWKGWTKIYEDHIIAALPD